MPEANHAIRLGIVGCGLASRRHHLPTLAALPEFTVAAIADTDPASLEEAAKRFGIPQRFSSHHEMLAGADLDAVVVATPTSSHAEIGLDVLHARKHMFMEKPLAMNLDECDELMEASAAAQTRVLVAHNSRWHRLAVHAREMIRSGLLGTVKAIRSVYTHAHDGSSAQPWHKVRALGGGVMFNDGVHHFDLWRYLLDTEVVQIQADSIDSTHFEDDTCTVSARLANGALASAVFSFSTSPNSEVEIFGESGSLLLSLYRFDGLSFTPHTALPGSIATRIEQTKNFVQSLPAGLSALRRGGDFDATYDAMWRHYADCILRDATPACTLSDGRASLAAALACLDSASSGRPVRLG